MNEISRNRILKADMILATLEKQKIEEEKGINENILTSFVCLKFGSGKRYIKEIIDDLVNCRRITRFEGKLYIV